MLTPYEELIEKLSDKEHASWSNWMRYLFEKCEIQADGTAVIPAALVDRWSKQAMTAYADLSRAEKASDRAEVAQIMPLIDDYIDMVADCVRFNG